MATRADISELQATLNVVSAIAVKILNGAQCSPDEIVAAKRTVLENFNVMRTRLEVRLSTATTAEIDGITTSMTRLGRLEEVELCKLCGMESERRRLVAAATVAEVW